MRRRLAVLLAGLSPREIWEQLGEDGRALLRQHVGVYLGLTTTTNKRIATRRASKTMVISGVETMSCAPDPVERVAQAWGCNSTCCTTSWHLQQKPLLHETLAGGTHAGALLRAFLADPDLMYPADIPVYAAKRLAHIRALQVKLAALKKRTDARNAAGLARAGEAARRATDRKSRAGRIERRKQQIAYLETSLEQRHIENEQQIKKLRAVEKALKTRIAKAQRSLAALCRLEEKKL